MTFQAIFWIVMAFLTFIVLPIGMVWTVVNVIRGKTKMSDEGGGGGVSGYVGGAMMELDKLARPSVEHTIELEDAVGQHEDDTGGQ